MTALEFLLTEKIDVLPVKPTKIAKRHGYVVKTFQEFHWDTDMAYETLLSDYSEDGFTILLGGLYVIAYNPNQVVGRIRWTLMHEICHIQLGHLSEECPVVHRSSEKDELDTEVDRMVSLVLCPPIVAHQCGVGTARELEQLAGLSREAAGYSFREVEKLKKRMPFFLTDEEEALCRQFGAYIEEYRGRKREPVVTLGRKRPLPY